VEGKLVTQTYDLAVVGGGPAGTSAAITAAQLGLRVLLLEARAFPRHKVCGEFLSGEAVGLLTCLLDRPSRFSEAPKIAKTRIFLDERVAQLEISPPAISLSRYELDAALWSRAEDLGAETRERTMVTKIRRVASLFAIETALHSATARAVIDASGRWSNLHSARVAQGENYIGLKAHFYEPAHLDSCDLYFFPGGYCGVQPLGDGQVNAAAMVSVSRAKSLKEVFALHPRLAQRAVTWKAASEPVSTAPLLFAPPRTNDAGVLLAGDAAAFIDPFAGDGISIALHSGRMASLASANYLGGKCSLAAAGAQYECDYRKLIHPALLNASRVRQLIALPKALRAGAMSLLNVPAIGRVLVKSTRVAPVSSHH